MKLKYHCLTMEYPDTGDGYGRTWSRSLAALRKHRRQRWQELKRSHTESDPDEVYGVHADPGPWAAFRDANHITTHEFEGTPRECVEWALTMGGGDADVIRGAS